MRMGFTKFLLLGRADARRFRFRASFQSAGAIASRGFRRRALRSSVFVCYSVMRQQVPKPMLESASEGE